MSLPEAMGHRAARGDKGTQCSSLLMAENRRDEKICLEAEKQPPKSTKYATSARNLQMGPYVISKRSQIHGFACIHLGWSPARRRAAQPPLLPGDTKHGWQAGSRAPTSLGEIPHPPYGKPSPFLGLQPPALSEEGNWAGMVFLGAHHP